MASVLLSLDTILSVGLVALLLTAVVVYALKGKK